MVGTGEVAWLICSIWFVRFVSFNQINEINQSNQIDRLLTPAGCAGLTAEPGFVGWR